MELILTKDFDNLGYQDDVVKVKPGYGRNFLIPKGYAVLATDSQKKQLAEKLKQRAHKESKLIQEAKELMSKLDNIPAIKLKVKVGKENKLYGSVTNSDVAIYLSEQGFSFDKKYIKIVGKTVKTVGKYTANIRLHREVYKDIEFEVIGID